MSVDINKILMSLGSKALYENGHMELRRCFLCFLVLGLH